MNTNNAKIKKYIYVLELFGRKKLFPVISLIIFNLLNKICLLYNRVALYKNGFEFRVMNYGHKQRKHTNL